MDKHNLPSDAVAEASTAFSDPLKSKGSTEFDNDFLDRIDVLLRRKPSGSNIPLPARGSKHSLLRHSVADAEDVELVDHSQQAQKVSKSETAVHRTPRSRGHSEGALETFRTSQPKDSTPKSIHDLRRGFSTIGSHQRRGDQPRNFRFQSGRLRKTRLPWLQENRWKNDTRSAAGIPSETQARNRANKQVPISFPGDANSGPTPDLSEQRAPDTDSDESPAFSLVFEEAPDSPEKGPSRKIRRGGPKRQLYQPRPLQKKARVLTHSPNSTPSPRSQFLNNAEAQPAVPLASLTTDPNTPPAQRPKPPEVSTAPDPLPQTRRPPEDSLVHSRSMHPVHESHAHQNHRDRIQESIAGLERMIQEAEELARRAADEQRDSEIPEILHEAHEAIQQASGVKDAQRQGVEVPLAEGGGAVPYEDDDEDLTDDDEDKTTFSRTTSEEADVQPVVTQPQIGASPIRVPVVHEAGPNRTSHVAQPVETDFALPTSDRSPQHDTPSPRTNPVRQRQPHGGSARPAALPTDADVQNHIRRHGEPPLLPRGTPVQQRGYGHSPVGNTGSSSSYNWGRDKYDNEEYVSPEALRGRHHVTLRPNQKFSIHHHRRQPIARNWSTKRKRMVAAVACVNTALIGLLVGIYAGEVPAIQYALNDNNHRVILGNVMFYIGMAITTFLFWPLPLLHGRKPYTLTALAVALPLQFPPAIIVSSRRVSATLDSSWITGLLLCRALCGLVLGFAHINFKSTLLDLFGASLQSMHPHGEFVVVDDVRRHGGGIGMWSGIWSFCFIGSIAIGFFIGAAIISGLGVSWGFYVSLILIAIALFLNVMTPETRRAPHRRTMQEVTLPNLNIRRRVARGEIRMHIKGDGPKWWTEEVWAGVYLSFRMLFEIGFGLVALYVGWTYGEIVLIIVLLGNLLSAGYGWLPQYVGLGVFAIAVGALIAIPNTKANWFSKSRSHPARTDSMTFERRVTWTSHMVRRAAFMTILPLAGIGYAIAFVITTTNYMVPIVLAGLIGYISNLGLAESYGLIMEAYDTSDLQPGVNSRHRLQSLPVATRRRRTAYSSYPRVSAGFFVADTLGFLSAAAATGVGGYVTRNVGASRASGITAGILFGLTILLTLALWRYKSVQVIPDHLFGSKFGGVGHGSSTSVASDKSWRAVIIGTPSGRIRRMNMLELGGLTRWTEIRRLNRLMLTKSDTIPLNEGWK